MGKRLDLLPAGTDGSTTGSAFRWPGGTGAFLVDGTIGGATITLEWSIDGTNFVAAGTDTTLTDEGGGLFTLPECLIRAKTAGGSGSSITALAIQVSPSTT